MNLSKEDQEFVKTYDDSKYAKPSVTADMVIFARGSEEEHLEVLLIQRGRPPFRGQYALPGGFVNPDESVDDAERGDGRGLWMPGAAAHVQHAGAGSAALGDYLRVSGSG